jgi:hydrogenase/urease accessory protein HupE
LTERRTRWRRLCLPLLGLIALVLLPASALFAHDVRPAYLQIDEIEPGRYQFLWRTPVLSGMPLPVVLQLPDGFRHLTAPTRQEFPDSLVERGIIDGAGEGLPGKRIEFPGLQATITEVLARVQLLDGTQSTTLVRPSQPWIDISLRQGSLVVAGAFLAHGVEHILFGFDHLLFVLALVLIVGNTRMLLLTVTAFTVAHSITLSLATLQLVHVPRPPVEACIALSILLVASEIVRTRRGEPSLTASRPWAVAFFFGLLHGLGFASALIDIGLPQSDIPLALLTFNVGVELGQLAFIGGVLGVMRVATQLTMPAGIEIRLRGATGYLIGIAAGFWFVERLAGFWM